MVAGAGVLVGGAEGSATAAALGVVTVSPIGVATGGSTVNNGADYGPDTPGTMTSGIQEALNYCGNTSGRTGKVQLLPGALVIKAPIVYTTNWPLCMEGYTRGVGTGDGNAYGTTLLCNALSSGEPALTLNAASFNYCWMRLAYFAVRGQALSYSGGTPGAMAGISLGTLANYGSSPAALDLDELEFDYLTNPLVISNNTDGPIRAGVLGFGTCQGSNGLIQLQGATTDIQHIEAYGYGGNILGLATGGSLMQLNIGSIYSSGSAGIINYGLGLSGTTPIYLHIGQLNVANNSGALLLALTSIGTGGAFICHIDQLLWGSFGQGAGGELLQGQGDNTTDVIQLTIDSFVGTPNYFIDNYFSNTVGAGSFLNIRNATLTAAPGNADVKYANMWAGIREVGTNFMQASLTGTTAGTALSQFDNYSDADKRFKVYLNGYENTTGTAQTITFPYPFAKTPAIMHDDSGGASVSATTLTLPDSMSSTKTGWILVEGY